MKSAPAVCLLGLVVGSACTSFGPRTVARDRFDYHQAIGRSRKEQMLLNIVQLRYLDAPVFLEVGQIVAGYNFEGTLGASGTAVSAGNDFVSLSGSARYVERPTITYAPIVGARFIELLLTPIPPGSILFLIESGWPVGLILRLTVESVNGLHNFTSTPLRHAPEDEGFFEVIDLMESLQREDWIGIHVERGEGEKLDTVVSFRTQKAPRQGEEQVGRLKELLGLDSARHEFEVGYGPPTSDGSEVNMLSRSMLQILFELSAGVQVPPAHAEEGWTLPVIETEKRGPMVRIRSSESRPSDAYAAVRYEAHWFWIENGDLSSKQLLSFLLMMLNFVETETPGALPVVTIPTG